MFQTEDATTVFGTPRSWTVTDEVQAIIGPFIPSTMWGMPNGFGGIKRFEGLTHKALGELLKIAPKAQRKDQQNLAPPFEQMYELGVRFPGLLYNGYIVDPDRNDERITIEGFYVPLDQVDSVQAFFEELKVFNKDKDYDDILVGEPDEWDEDTFNGVALWWAWWD